MEPQILILEDHDGGDWALCRVAYFDELINQRDRLLDVLQAFIRAYDGPTVDIGTAIASTIPAARAAVASLKE